MYIRINCPLGGCALPPQASAAFRRSSSAAEGKDQVCGCARFTLNFALPEETRCFKRLGVVSVLLDRPRFHKNPGPSCAPQPAARHVPPLPAMSRRGGGYLPPARGRCFPPLHPRSCRSGPSLRLRGAAGSRQSWPPPSSAASPGAGMAAPAISPWRRCRRCISTRSVWVRGGWGERAGLVKGWGGVFPAGRPQARGSAGGVHPWGGRVAGVVRLSAGSLNGEPVAVVGWF